MIKRLKDYDMADQEWHGLYTIHDPLVCELLAKVKSYTWKGYELWLHGSILEDRVTYDLDMTLIGPKNPRLINQYLYLLTKLGYVHNIKVDVKYLLQGKMYNHKEYLKTGKRQDILYANATESKYGIYHENMWITAFSYPIAKLFHPDRDPQEPIRLV